MFRLGKIKEGAYADMLLIEPSTLFHVEQLAQDGALKMVVKGAEIVCCTEELESRITSLPQE